MIGNGEEISRLTTLKKEIIHSRRTLVVALKNTTILGTTFIERIKHPTFLVQSDHSFGLMKRSSHLVG